MSPEPDAAQDEKGGDNLNSKTQLCKDLPQCLRLIQKHIVLKEYELALMYTDQLDGSDDDKDLLAELTQNITDKNLRASI